MSLSADAHVKTAKAERYLKALCNHFSHKVTAEYDDRKGSVTFDFGSCQMEATDDDLAMHVTANDEDGLARVKSVIASHLERFSGDEALKVAWNEVQQEH